MPLSYTVTLNVADDDAPLDLTADVQDMRWRLGAETPEQALAPPGRARLMLANAAGRYTAAALAWVGRGLSIRAHDGITERFLFSGTVAAITPGAGPDEAGMATLEAVTPDAGLAELRARLPPVTDAAPGPLIEALLTDLPLRRPNLRGVWVLGASGFGELNSAAQLADPLALPVQADAGIARFALAALGGLSAEFALRQIVVSEGGRCAVGRDGVLVFHDRHRPLRALTTAATFSDSMRDLGWINGGWANQVHVRFTPVRVGDPDSLLWALERPQRLPSGVRQMTVRFRDADGAPLAAWSVDRLTASATRNADGTGGPALLEAVLIRRDAREAVLEFRNPGAEAAWLTTDTRLYGVPLEFSPPLAVEQTDALSLAVHGPRQLDLDLPLVDSLDEADGRARFDLLRAPAPTARAAWIACDLRSVPAALALTLGDRIRVQDSTTGHDASYLVIGEAHTVDEGEARHRVRLFLEPAPITRFWELGLCALETETTLAY